ncbi:glycosyltransferase family 4 protein [Halorubrum ezzemoulense]|uniref:Glycosyltransferase family 4 protein n=1 Tax=Halorubrum ezzemoulense TaxID=337243 RepID=A0ABT4Z7H2_HALEZ|nr:glycosyltransferase family 4 protein [Halorubrum ezzemoulense]MDB2246502.1 glycosyltransferase family 4 protein [Halorubrum ezzemoulense]MDB2280130.1 glycosyltransferase family 4 protein [Halorubrum ezzemoulense]MDB2290548.1 glycosyltransferase family 4 protein [Halorubrum ezzemoulense]MDB2294022.1 glycosyltransferase family 4 protein [Halorubrum ezzemoulense]MDB2298028.1 glycosyltransferase family 4 protein [Halorubrum ezzemoulense]
MEQLGILYYVGSFPKLSESFILNEISELTRRGHNVAVFALNNPDEEVTHNEYEDVRVPVYYANTSYADLPELFSRKPLQMGIYQLNDGFFKMLSPKQAGHNLLLGRRCSEFIGSLEFSVDVIHGHFANPNKVGGMLAARDHDISCTVTAHAVEIFKHPNVDRIQYVCDVMDHVVVPSEYNRRYLREKIGVQNDITVIPATTRIDKFKPSGSTVKNRFLTVARLVEKKGIQFAIEAVNSLIGQGYNIEYHIIGTGNQREQLRKQVKKYGIGDSVNFLGHVTDERLRQELSEACVFVLPCIIAENGDRDAMPVALKEAMASETVCVSTTVSAIPELITDGENGRLVPPKEPEMLAEALKQLLRNPKIRQDLAQNGRDTVHKKFKIRNSVDRLEDVFSSVMSAENNK